MNEYVLFSFAFEIVNSYYHVKSEKLTDFKFTLKLLPKYSGASKVGRMRNIIFSGSDI